MHACAPCRFYTAKVTSIYSGMFEFWTSGTDHNVNPSTDNLRCVRAQEASRMGESC